MTEKDLRLEVFFFIKEKLDRRCTEWHRLTTSKDKTAEQVAEILESRVKIYLSEQS